MPKEANRHVPGAERLRQLSRNPHIIDAEQLRTISGKRTAPALRRWAHKYGIRVLDGKEGPWTTVEAINQALGLGATASETAYAPDIV